MNNMAYGARRSLEAVAFLVLASCTAGGRPAPLATSAAARDIFPRILDPQLVRDQDLMTWADYKPIPGVNWANEQVAGTVKQMKLAIITADFEDQPFVMTLPKRSDLYGNPQIDPVTRAQIPRFYEEFYNKPSPVNHGHTIHEYWMEQSRGRIGITATAFGPYRMPSKVFQYGGLGQGDMPAGHEPEGRGLSGSLDSLWRADKGDTIVRHFDIVLRMYAGYDETAMWQEFGEMKFQTREDITRAFGNPDTTKPRWVRTRYVPWTSWHAGQWLWSNSAIVQGEAISTIRHEISHFAFRIGDNYNNPFVQPYRRAPAGPWDLMDRGSFNGPGGPHRRWLSPPVEGGSMSAGLMLRQRLAFSFVDSANVLFLSRDGLARSGLAVANVTARAVAPPPGALAGVHVRLDGATPRDKTPVDDPSTNANSSGTPDFDFYTMEVVQRIGYDSYTPDNGVLIAKNKDAARPVGGPNGYSTFTWVIDADPSDINMLDFKRPNGEPVMRTVADYRQLNDALFHAGLNSGSEYEWKDNANRLHFYVVDIHRDTLGILSYTLAVRSLDGSGPQTRGVALQAPDSSTRAGQLLFTLRNTGIGAEPPAGSQSASALPYLGADVYRLSVAVRGNGWEAQLQNSLAACDVGGTRPVQVFLRRSSAAAATAEVVLTATSESDTTKKASVSYKVRR